MARWLQSLHVQLFLWAVMPVTFLIIAVSFTGVYSHQQTMRDFVVERDRVVAQMAAQIAERGLASGVVGGDGSELGEWMTLYSLDSQGTLMVLDQTGRILAHSYPAQVGKNARDLPGASVALAERQGSTIAQGQDGPLLLTFVPVQGVDWIVVASEPVEELIGPLLRFPSLIPIIAAGAGILSLVILFFGWWTIVRPLQQLARATEQVSWKNPDDRQVTALASSIRGVQEIRDLHRALTAMVDRLRDYQIGVHDYLSAVTEGQEAERARLARELHDGPVQALIVLGQRAEIAQRLMERGQDAQASNVLQELRRTGQATIQDLRRLIGALRPVYLEDLGFAPALEMLIQQSAELTDTQIDLDIGPHIERLPSQVELAAYRIAQEAVHNAVQHAQAAHIRIHVRCEAQVLVLTVADDGIGFQVPDQPRSLTREGHFGLVGMRERAAQLGGALQILSAPGEGTQIVVRLPGQR
jgi:signal transduction histidine kinase